jgi:hypothetical protein
MTALVHGNMISSFVLAGRTRSFSAAKKAWKIKPA